MTWVWERCQDHDGYRLVRLSIPPEMGYEAKIYRAYPVKEGSMADDYVPWWVPNDHPARGVVVPEPTPEPVAVDAEAEPDPIPPPPGAEPEPAPGQSETA